MKKIYIITNIISGLRYVGLSKDPIGRYDIHMRSLRGGYHHNSIMQNEFSKYGENSFTMEILGDGTSLDESMLIKEIGDCNVIGKSPSDETRLKMSLARIGKPSVRKGAKNSAEMNEKIRASLIGNTRAKGKKHKVVSWNKGKPWTEARRLAQKNKSK